MKCFLPAKRDDREKTIKVLYKKVIAANDMAICDIANQKLSEGLKDPTKEIRS